MVMLPLYDHNPRRLIAFPFVNYGLIACCVAVFFWQMGLSDPAASFFGFGVVPAVLNGDLFLDRDIASAPAWATLLTSQFLHSGWLHLGANMLFLWVFGDNIEDTIGHYRYLLFYLGTGVIAAIAHVLTHMDSAIPMVGASGAISGILGAYLVLFPRADVTILIFKKIPIRLKAWVVLGFWIGFQVVSFAAISYANLTRDVTTEGGAEDGVAWMAHIGGFVAGALLIPAFRPEPASPQNGPQSP